MKPIKTNTLLTVLSCISFLLSCKSDDTPIFDTNTNFLNYHVFYDNGLNTSMVTAEFRKDNPLGSNLKLEDDESITFKGEVLSYNETTSVYSRTFNGLISSGDFVYSSSEGNTYTSSLTAFESIGLPSSFNTVSKNEGITVEWEGSSLEENESVVIVIGEYEDGEEIGTFVDGEGASSVQVDGVVLTVLPTGIQPAYIDRRRVNFLSEEESTSVGGRIITTYRSETIQVEVTE